LRCSPPYPNALFCLDRGFERIGRRTARPGWIAGELGVADIMTVWAFGFIHSILSDVAVHQLA
jgi:hypothetical protein